MVLFAVELPDERNKKTRAQAQKAKNQPCDFGCLTILQGFLASFEL
jgi:hypothetical protein